MIEDMALAPAAVRSTNLILLGLVDVPSGRRCIGPADIPAEEAVDWSRIVNRLKVMCNLDPIPFAKPRRAMFELVVGGQGFTVHIDFPAGIEMGSLTISWESKAVDLD